MLANGKIIPVLRTWCGEKYEPVVDYGYQSDDGVISTRNVYETWRGSEPTVEKWTGDSGLLD